KGKVTVLHPDKIGRRQRGATEACFLHVAGKRRGSRLPRLPGGEQLPKPSNLLGQRDESLRGKIHFSWEFCPPGLQ
ncbi:MAG: hypothetical protein OXB88_07645, partial [Bacteriovoracales bacterium]|nr:hypothetical protein [Bacteriovoracales bacterium]